MSRPRPAGEPEPAADYVDWERFDTDAHRAAQANCWCVIACAVDGATRQAVAANLAYARRVGDAAAIPILIAQLTGPCVLPPAPADENGALTAE